MSQFYGLQVPPEVIRAAADGDPAAHEAIYRACGRAVYTLIRRLVRPSAADDLFQEVFVEILRSAASYSGEGAFAGWVRTITVNKCLTHLRSPWQRSRLWLDDEGDAPGFELVDGSPHPEAQAVASADLERALAQLPALTRSVVWLHDVEGYTHQEIASSLGRTASFSKSQLARAHVRLRQLLEPGVAAPALAAATPAVPVATPQSPNVSFENLSCTPV